MSDHVITLNPNDILTNLIKTQDTSLPSFDLNLNCTHILVVFRQVQVNVDGVKEHPVNEWSAKLTSRRDDVAPCGTFCHVELCIQFSENQWYRISINKKTAQIDEKTGRTTWTPGTVHVKHVSETTLSRYVICKLPCARERQYALVETFLRTQVGAPFHTLGYICNGLLGTRFGVWKYHDRLKEQQRKWFCSELVCCMLQMLGVGELGAQRCCSTNPNMLYRILQKNRCAVHTRDPMRDIAI